MSRTVHISTVASSESTEMKTAISYFAFNRNLCKFRTLRLCYLYVTLEIMQDFCWCFATKKYFAIFAFVFVAYDANKANEKKTKQGKKTDKRRPEEKKKNEAIKC